MVRSFFIAACVLALAGCSAQAAPDYGWSFQQDEHEGAKLAYGAPSSDDVVLMMTCAPGSGHVLLSAVTERTREEIVLASGGARDRFSGELLPSELGGLLLEAKAQAEARSLTGFARTGKLSMAANGETISLAAHGEEREGVSQFFETCRA
jgi:hypothetical protein